MKYCCNNFRKFEEEGEIFDRIEFQDNENIHKLWKHTVMTIMKNYIPLWYCPFCGARLLEM